MHAKARTIMEKQVTIRIKLWDEKMNFFTWQKKNNFTVMFEHKLLGFTTLDLGCPLSKDGSAIQENTFFK